MDMMPERILVVVPSCFFTIGKTYEVQRWLDGWPRVRNDVGTFTWLHNPRWWCAVPNTEAPARARYSP